MINVLIIAAVITGFVFTYVYGRFCMAVTNLENSTEELTKVIERIRK